MFSAAILTETESWLRHYDVRQACPENQGGGAERKFFLPISIFSQKVNNAMHCGPKNIYITLGRVV